MASVDSNAKASTEEQANAISSSSLFARDRELNEKIIKTCDLDTNRADTLVIGIE